MTWSLNCFCEEEPAGFHPDGVRGISVRLSVATEEADQATAQAQLEALLGRLEEIDGKACFAIYYLIDRRTLVRIDGRDDVTFSLLSEDFDPRLSSCFVKWLNTYGKGAVNKAFYTRAARVGQHASTGETTDAHDVILASASRLAPLPQRLHLSFVLRVALPKDLTDGTGGVPELAIVPCFAQEKPLEVYRFDADQSGEVEIVVDSDEGKRGGRTTLIKPLAPVDPTTNVNPATGFCAGSRSTAEVHAALLRFEQRAGSLFTGFVAAGEFHWDTAESRTLRLQETQHVRRLAWRAAASLASALDPLLLALAMPGREKRDGALAAPLLDALAGSQKEALEAGQEGEAKEAPGVAVTRDALRTGLRDGLRALTRKINGDAQADRPAFVATLKKLCLDGMDPEASRWLRILLTAFEERNGQGWLKAVDDWNDPKRLGNETSPRAEQQVRELERNLADLNERLTGESGVETALMAILRQEAVSGALLAVLKTQGAMPEKAALGVLDKALADFEAKLGSDINGAQVSRQAAGSLLVDLLVLDLHEREPPVPMTLAALKGAVENWNFWPARLGIAPARGILAVLFDALIFPVKEPLAFFAHLDEAHGDYEHPVGIPGEVQRELERVATEMQEDVLKELFPGGDDRFIPDSSPRSLAVHVAVDPAADDSGQDADEFSAAYAGMSLLMSRRFAGDGTAVWAYANLADIQLLEDKSLLEGVNTLQPLPTTVEDGRRNLFQTYDGVPFSSAAFRAPPAPDALFETDYPETTSSKEFQPLPALAYGAWYDVVAHTIGRSGSLPQQLQRDMPWRPEADIGFQDPGVVTSIAYSRTTAIGQTFIADAGTARRIGVTPPNVRPLSADYPRITLAASNSVFLDVFRNTDGSGAIAWPAEGGQTSAALHHIWNWSKGVLQLKIDVIARPAADLEVEGGDTMATFSLSLEPGVIVDAAAVLIERGAGGGATISLQGSGQSVFVVQRPGRGVWLRLRAPGGESGASLSLNDPSGDMRGSAAASRPVPDRLLLVGLGNVWRAPHGQPSQVSIGFPRVSYLDFERWINNPALRVKVFGTLVPDKHVDYFCSCLLATHIGRGHNRHERLALLLDRLPDPAVGNIELEVMPADALRNAPAKLSGVFPAQRVAMKFPSLGEVLAQELLAVDTTVFDPAKFEALLAAVDKRYSRAFRISAAARLSPNLALSETGLEVPEGLCVRLTARPQVAAGYFTAADGQVSVIDARLRQYALGKGTAQDALLFEGGTLLVEAMTGPLQRERLQDKEIKDPWYLDREAWDGLARARVTHRAGKSRDYELVAAPKTGDWQWRQLGWIDVHTQRWRYMGMPIDQWPTGMPIDPIDQWPTHPGALHRTTGTVSFEPSSAASLEVKAFELQAFHRRLDSDAEVKTTPLSTLEDETALIKVQWDKPSATWFRHRLVLRSRYAGAMMLDADTECDAWPKSRDADPPDVTQWRRVVMLAERGAIEMTRPQLRALMPLTTSPDEDLLSTPPVAAILHDEPFAQGGLAERIAAEVTTGVGYGASDEAGTGTPAQRVRAIDARKEVGPDPRLSYAATPARQAQLTVLLPEGPLGLTYDATHGGGQMFPNSSWMLHPRQLMPAGAAPGPAGLEEHFVSVAMRRYLDWAWLVDEDPVEPAFNLTWWLEHTCMNVAQSVVYLEDASAKARVSVACCEVEDGDIVVKVDRAVIDLSALDPEASGLPRTDTHPLVLCRVPGAAATGCRLAFLHAPVDRQNASLSVFLLPAQPDGAAPGGRSHAPVLLASIDWSIPQVPADPTQPDGPRLPLKLACGSNTRLARTNASQTTALNWVRTNRNFDTVHVGGLDAGRDRVMASELMATWGKAKGVIKVASSARTDQGKRIWARSEQSTRNFPVHAQRHVAALLSSVDKGVGRAVEQLRQAHMLTGVETGVTGAAWLNDEVANVRLVEFELPAQIIGFIPGNEAAIPAAFRCGYFDLMSIGHMTGDRFLSFHFRLIGSVDARTRLKSLKIGLRADESTSTAGSWKFGTLARRTDAVAEVVALQLDVTLDGAWKASVTGGRWLTSTGEIESLSADAMTNLALVPSGASGAEGLGLRIEEVGGSELWFEIGFLASANLASGFGGAVDFDWFFGPSKAVILDGVAAGATSEASLRLISEAQARVIAVSPPIALTKET